MKKPKRHEHTCRRATGCHCSSQALEPADDCPVHGGSASWPDRCAVCGKFLPAHIRFAEPDPPPPSYNPG